MTTPAQIQSMIMEQLAAREMRVLSLVVAIRRIVGRSELMKGDLAAMVTSALKRLVTSKAVVDNDGTFSLRTVNPAQNY
jgi:hypothetical protein